MLTLEVLINSYVHSSVTIPCCWSSRPGKLTIYSHWPKKRKILIECIFLNFFRFFFLPFTLNATLGWIKCVLVGQTIFESFDSPDGTSRFALDRADSPNLEKLRTKKIREIVDSRICETYVWMNELWIYCYLCTLLVVGMKYSNFWRGTFILTVFL